MKPGLLLILFSISACQPLPPVTQARNWKNSALTDQQVAFLRELSEQDPSLPGLFARFSGEYHARGYAPTEFSSLVSSIEALVTKGYSPDRAAGCGVKEYSALGHPVVLLDPSCEKCAEVVRLLQDIHLKDGRPHFILTPNSEEISRKSAIALSLIRRRSPEDFVTALSEFLLYIPREPQRLGELMVQYLGSDQLEDTTDVLQEVTEASELAGCLGIAAPIILSNNRVVVRDVRAEVPFDPYRDGLHLELILKLIDAQVMNTTQRRGGSR